MKEGWINEEYLIVFDNSESEHMTRAYGVSEYLPGHTLFGILGWDDFLTVNEGGVLYSVPTVPMIPAKLRRHERIHDLNLLVPDRRYSGKIKWYVKPIVFGGAPDSEENTTWVDIETHQKAVRYWNRIFHQESKG